MSNNINRHHVFKTKSYANEEDRQILLNSDDQSWTGHGHSNGSSHFPATNQIKITQVSHYPWSRSRSSFLYPLVWLIGLVVLVLVASTLHYSSWFSCLGITRSHGEVTPAPPCSILSSVFNKYFSVNLNDKHLYYYTQEEIFDLILRDSSDSPTIVSTDHHRTNQSLESLSKCSHFSCFNIYLCDTIQYDSSLKKNNLIKVYVYPSFRYVTTNGSQSRALNADSKSNQFTRLLYAIISSPYYTADPDEACLFVPNLDLLNLDRVNLEDAQQILWSLPYFAKHNGSNHLLFSMLPPSNGTYSFDIGNSLMASAHLVNGNVRSYFDVSIPMFSIHSQVYSNQALKHPSNSPKLDLFQRKWTLIGTQTHSVSFETSYYLNQLESMHSNQMLLLGDNCSSTQQFEHHNVCNIERKFKYQYLQALKSSQFCLIFKTSFVNTELLSDALMSGCIPVILIDDLILPFQERIDWQKVAVRVREHSVSRVFDIVNNISEQRRHRLQLNGHNVWQKFFSSIEAITLTTLDIINDRVFYKPKAVDYTDSHQSSQLVPMTFDFYSKGYGYIAPKNEYLQTIGFSAIILTYNRVESLYEIIQSISEVPSCVKIFVVWNNQEQAPAAAEHWPSVTTPVQVIRTSSNKLRNRFYPYASIETEAIFAIDDDITMLSSDEIEFAYQTWREFPDRIVGFPSRLHFWNNLTRSWAYDSEWKNQISLILTGAAFYHSYYNHLYTHVMPETIRDWVDTNMNCEDIAMNFLVSNITGKAPIKVAPRKKFKFSESKSNTNSNDVFRHLKLRSDCIDKFAQIYQSMPLKSVEFRSNPVLFGDNIPEKFKQFIKIGSL